MKWEYMVIKELTGRVLGGKLDGQALTDELNKLGAPGWELVSILDTSIVTDETRDVFAVLKRPLSS